MLTSTMLITELFEIDLYQCMKFDKLRHNGRIRVALPPPFPRFITLQLASTKQHYGQRIWFLCLCGRRVSRLYLQSSFDFRTNYILCRHCLNLKYASQHRTSIEPKLDMTKRKLSRLQGRKLWYLDEPNRFGRQFYRLQEQEKKLTKDIDERFHARTAMFISKARSWSTSL